MQGLTRRTVTRTILMAALSPMAVRAAVAPIRIGAVLSLTGPYASLGTSQRNAFALFPGTIAGRPVEVQVEDASDAGMAEAACRRLMEANGIDILFGTTVRPTTLPAIPIPIASATGTPMISFAASSAVIEPQEGARRWMFKPAPADRLTTDPLLAHMAANRIASFVTIAFSTAYGDGLVAAIGAGAAARGLRTLAVDRSPRPPRTSRHRPGAPWQATRTRCSWRHPACRSCCP